MRGELEGSEEGGERMRTQLGELPGKGSPAEGELLVHRTSAALSRRGRTEVRVRVVVPGSLGWVKVAEG